MKVSVSIITYNQEDFIAQAIESVLMQKTNFDFEILIGDDGSSDGTCAIIEQYQAENPDRIRIFHHDRSSVLQLTSHPTGKWNLMNNLSHATGEYIALLDGDDYWTDPLKLQKQVDFLETHPTYGICFTHTYSVHCNKQGRETERRLVRPPGGKATYTVEDLLMRHIGSTCTAVFRNHLRGGFPEWFGSSPFGDWPLYVLSALQGPIGFLEVVTAAHRVYQQSIWSSIKLVDRQKALIRCREVIIPHLQPELQAVCKDAMFGFHWGLIGMLRAAGNVDGVREHAEACLALLPYHAKASVGQVLKLKYYQHYRPGLDRWFRFFTRQRRPELHKVAS